MIGRLAIGVVPAAGWSAADIRAVAREAEDAGFEAIFNTEVNSDALATAQLMGVSTRTIKVGTWVANVYLRHAYLCAKAAAAIADTTEGRLILGLGVSHQPVNRALGIDMPDPIGALRQYTIEVAAWLRGDGPATHLPQQPSPYPVPIYLGALTSKTVELAGELADGVMPFLWSADRITQSKTWSRRGRAQGARHDHLELTLGLPTFVGDDLAAMMASARANLALYTTLPFFQHLLRVSGFTAEAERAEAGAGGDALSDRFLDAVCLIGPVERCREHLATFRAAGLDLPILMPPIGVQGTRDVIKAFSS
jgi:alkanesulfonate monooxygenase SsuD/methylene tetrahydromethanopterin reductase-like flavin-dependent oxidoreductase (luciferase family)